MAFRSSAAAGSSCRAFSQCSCKGPWLLCLFRLYQVLERFCLGVFGSCGLVLIVSRACLVADCVCLWLFVLCVGFVLSLVGVVLLSCWRRLPSLPLSSARPLGCSFEAFWSSRFVCWSLPPGILLYLATARLSFPADWSVVAPRFRSSLRLLATKASGPCVGYTMLRVMFWCLAFLH